MGSSFAGLEIGRTGLMVAQVGLDVTSHNISNVDTKGYSRQRVVSTAFDPFGVIGRAFPASDALVGGGVRVKILDQIRSAYLDRRFRTESTLNAYWQKRTEGLSYIESYFDNVNEKTSINYSIAEFFRAVKIVAEDAVENPPRTLLRDAGLDLIQQFSSIYDGLIDLQDAQNTAVKVIVGDINRIAAEIVELNKSIYGFELTGHVANDLRDKRNLLLDDLSSLIDIKYDEYSDGKGHTKLSVTIGGEELLNHDKAWEVDVVLHKNNIPGEADVWAPAWKDMRTEPDTAAQLFIYDVFGADTGLTLYNKSGVDYDNITNPAEKEALVAKAKQLMKLFAANTPEWEDVVDDMGVFIGLPQPAKGYFDELNAMLGGVLYVFPMDPVAANDCIHTGVGVNGQILIHPCLGDKAETIVGALKLDGAKDKPYDPNPFIVTGGELKAYMDLRDGLGAFNNAGVPIPNDVSGIPYYIELMNNLARAIVIEVNKIHREGYTDHPTEGSTNGVNFFNMDQALIWQSVAGETLVPDGEGGWYLADAAGLLILDVDDNPQPVDPTDPASGFYSRWTNDAGDVLWLLPDPDFGWVDTSSGPPIPIDPYNEGYEQDFNVTWITAKNISLSAEVIESVYNIACSSVLVERGANGGDKETLQSGNNENMNALYKLFEMKNLVLPDKPDGTPGVSIGSLDGYATSIRFDIANTLNFAKKTLDTSVTLTLAAENQRLSVSGVSLDEEMVNLVKYQHAYNGAARVITVMDEMLDKLINGTGRVGL